MTISPEWQNLFDNLKPEIYASPELRQKFNEKNISGDVTAENDPFNHYVVCFLPYNPKTQEVFLVFYHNLGDIWIAPGGHVDNGEGPKTAVEREINEELGIIVDAPKEPFFIGQTQVKYCNNPKRHCRHHYDFWYLIESDGLNFKLTTEEFGEYKWVKIPEALALVTDISTHGALEKLLQLSTTSPVKG